MGYGGGGGGIQIPVTLAVEGPVVFYLQKKREKKERVKCMILSLCQHTLLQNVSVMKMLRLVEMQVNDFEKYNR